MIHDVNIVHKLTLAYQGWVLYNVHVHEIHFLAYRNDCADCGDLSSSSLLTNNAGINMNKSTKPTDVVKMLRFAPPDLCKCNVKECKKLIWVNVKFKFCLNLLMILTTKKVLTSNIYFLETLLYYLFLHFYPSRLILKRERGGCFPPLPPPPIILPFQGLIIRNGPLSFIVKVQGRILKSSESASEKCSRVIILLLTNKYMWVWQMILHPLFKDF